MISVEKLRRPKTIIYTQIVKFKIYTYKIESRSLDKGRIVRVNLRSSLNCTRFIKKVQINPKLRCMSYLIKLLKYVRNRKMKYTRRCRLSSNKSIWNFWIACEKLRDLKVVVVPSLEELCLKTLLTRNLRVVLYNDI